jgi:diadenosine tetraphosphate (Ap4A) HIT family hydrolase
MPSCPFYQVDRERVLVESDVALAFFDAYPVTEGHTLITPRQHVMSIYQLSADEQSICGRWWRSEQIMSGKNAAVV